jgi:hypothetical protein
MRILLLAALRANSLDSTPEDDVSSLHESDYGEESEEGDGERELEGDEDDGDEDDEGCGGPSKRQRTVRAWKLKGRFDTRSGFDKALFAAGEQGDSKKKGQVKFINSARKIDKQGTSASTIFKCAFHNTAKCEACFKLVETGGAFELYEAQVPHNNHVTAPKVCPLAFCGCCYS